MCDKHSCDKNMLLVKTIEKFPCLYNSTLNEYLKKDVTDKAWNEVANQTQLSVGECKEKWKNLRYGIIRSLRPHPDGTVKKRYYLHDEMEFVIPYIKPNPRHSSLTTVPLEDDEEMDSNEIEFENEATLAQQYFEFECVTEPQKKKSKKSESFKYSLTPKTSNNEDSRENARRMFLLSLLPELEVLTESQMRVFRRKVLELLEDCRETRNIYDNNILNWQSKLPSSHNETIKSEPI